MRHDIKKLQDEIYHQRLVVRAYRSDAENPDRLLREAARLEKLAEQNLQQAALLRDRAENVQDVYEAACAKLKELVKTERLLQDDNVKELLRLQKQLRKRGAK